MRVEEFDISIRAQIGYGEYMLYLVGAILLVTIVAAVWWTRQSLLHALELQRDTQSLALLQNQVNASAQQTGQQIEQLRNAFQQINAQIAQGMDTSRKTMDERLDKAAQVIQGVSKQLGQLDESSRRIFDVGKDIAQLQEILRAPKLRGNLSELFLDDLLSQILPPDHYETQHAFRFGETVDAVIKLKAGMVPVDAKFPLEHFRAIVAAQTEDDRKAAKKAFIKDVRIHVDAIASKYIRTDEGTFDFALMYIPAENVYYETVIKDTELGGEMALFNYALTRRVIPVSPNSFYAYLQTILLGLKGMRVEESAREMLNSLAGLQKEFERFDEAFRLIGQHLDNSVKKYEDAEKRLDKIGTKFEQFDSSIKGLNPPHPASQPSS